MKKILLCGLVLVLVQNVFSQLYQTTNKDSVKIFTDMMAAATPRKISYLSKTDNMRHLQFSYNYVSKDLYDNDMHYTDDAFVNQKNHKRYIGASFVFRVDTTTPNPTYIFMEVAGKFEDIYPIWKKYFNPSSDEQAAKSNLEERAAILLPNGEKRIYEIYGNVQSCKIFRIGKPRD